MSETKNGAQKIVAEWFESLRDENFSEHEAIGYLIVNGGPATHAVLGDPEFVVQLVEA